MQFINYQQLLNTDTIYEIQNIDEKAYVMTINKSHAVFAFIKNEFKIMKRSVSQKKWITFKLNYLTDWTMKLWCTAKLSLNSLSDNL